MLFRHFKTGLAVGIAALAGTALVGFSPHVGATEIGNLVPAVTAETEAGAGDAKDASVADTYRARLIAAESFGGEDARIKRVSLTDAAGTTMADLAGHIWIKFARPIRYNFDIELTVTGAELADTSVVGQPKALDGARDATGATGRNFIDAGNECSGFTRNGRTVLLTSCATAAIAETANGITAMQIEVLNLTRAQGLGSAGHAITLTAALFDAGDDEVIHESAPKTIYRSAHTATAAVNTGRPLSVDPESTPPFARIAGGTPSGQSIAALGHALIVGNAVNSVGTDGQLAPLTVESVVSGASVSVSHGAFADDAFYGVSMDADGPTATDGTGADPAMVVLGSSTNPDADVVEDGKASFMIETDDFVDGPLPPTSTERGIPINIHFDGRTRISSWAPGSATITFNDARNSLEYSVPPGAEGALARISRGGLSVHLNGVRNSAGNGADLYQSVIRITNNGVVPGSVDVSVYDSSDGEMVGEFTSSTIAAGTMIQWTSAMLEDAANIDVSEDPVLYTVRIEGAIAGYVQHLNWNSVDNLFSDLSGFRNGQLTGAP